MEQHARWIADSGAGAIDVSWWGPDSNVNEVIPTLMDVMAAHDIHVTFYVEPYTERHAENYARDLHVPDQELRRPPALGLLPAERARGRHGRSGVQVVPHDPAAHRHRLPRRDQPGRRLRGRRCVAAADRRDPRAAARRLRSRDAPRRFHPGGAHAGRRLRRHRALRQLRVAGHLAPARRRTAPAATWCSRFRSIRDSTASSFRRPIRNSCYVPPAFAPGGGVYDWTRAADRAAAETASRGRIADSFNTTVNLQTSPALANAARGSSSSTSTRSTSGTRAISSSRRRTARS